MPKLLFCDICGLEDADEDYEGRILCKWHRAKQNLRDLQRKYEGQKVWVENNWIIPLRQIKQEIDEIRNYLASHEEPKGKSSI